jgi:hypothetical protein
MITPQCSHTVDADNDNVAADDDDDYKALVVLFYHSTTTLSRYDKEYDQVASFKLLLSNHCFKPMLCQTPGHARVGQCRWICGRTFPIKRKSRL